MPVAKQHARRRGLYFNTVGDSASYNKTITYSLGQNMTLLAIVRRTFALGGIRTIVGNNSGGISASECRIACSATGQLDASFGGESKITTSTAMADTEWHGLGATFDGTQSVGNRVLAYIDGALRTGADAGDNSDLTASTNNWGVGGDNGRNNRWVGDLKAACAIQATLTADQVFSVLRHMAGNDPGATIQAIGRITRSNPYLLVQPGWEGNFLQASVENLLADEVTNLQADAWDDLAPSAFGVANPLEILDAIG